MKASQLLRTHAEYAFLQPMWRRLEILYDNALMEASITDFLTQRPQELPEVYTTRQQLFEYENIIGACLGFFRSALFKKSPGVKMRKVDENSLAVGELSDEEAGWYAGFRKNTDGARGSFVSHLKDIFISFALSGRGYTLIDLPKAAPGQSVADMKRLRVVDGNGKPNPRAKKINVLNVINWSINENDGQYDWVLLHTPRIDQPSITEDPVSYDYWTLYDRQKYYNFRRKRSILTSTLNTLGLSAYLPGSETDSSTVEVLGSDFHALAKANRVPLVRTDVTDTLWLGKRAYFPSCAHIDISNSLHWQLFMAGMAIPVIACDGDITPKLNLGGFIKLPANATFKWTEPEGKTAQIAMAQKNSLREEIYRLMYLMYQGKQGSATADGASGDSKEQEMSVATEAMNEFGDHLISHGQDVLNMVALARNEGEFEADITGMRFGRSLTIAQVQTVEATLALDIPSEIFEKAVESEVVTDYFEDADPQFVDSMIKQVQSAPSRADRLAMATAANTAAEQGPAIDQPRPLVVPKVRTKG